MGSRVETERDRDIERPACLYGHRFQNLQARQIIVEFVVKHNAKRMIGRLGFQTPASRRAARDSDRYEPGSPFALVSKLSPEFDLDPRDAL